MTTLAQYNKPALKAARRTVHGVGMEMDDKQAVASRFWRDGYALIPNVFDPAEVSQWRAIALEDRARAELLSRPRLREIICDPRLIGYARAILGGQPVYFGDSTAAIGSAEGQGFHKDNTDRYDGAAPDWGVDRYPTIRFGIYTQPHGALPEGLDLKVGSHMMPHFLAGKSVSPPVEPGDLLVWNGRTSHSANSPRLRILGTRVEANGFVWKVIRKLGAEYLYAKHPQERVAFFATYAAKHPLLDRHIAYLKTRQYAVANMRGIHWTDEAKAMALSSGLALLQPDPSDATAQHVDYHPMPYDAPVPTQAVVSPETAAA